MNAAVNVMWQGSPRPPDSGEWEKTIQTAFGHANGKVQMLPAASGCWRVASAWKETGGAYRPGDKFPTAKDVRDDVAHALREAGLPIG